MVTATNVHTSVGVHVWARSTTWVANEVARVLLEVADHRGLPLDYMHKRLDTLVAAFRCWITGRHLRGALLEIRDDRGRLLERYDLALAYQPAGGGPEERYDTQLDRLHALLAARPRLPAGARYRVVVDLDDEAPALPGWSASEPSDTSHLQRQEVGGVIHTARIGVQLQFWG
jgi:hypothetical protein